MAGVFTEHEKVAVRAKYPGLSFPADGVCEGVFDLHAVFEEQERCDTFKISILAPEDYPASVPLLSETGGRTEEIARKHNIKDTRDLHRNPSNGSACVCVKQEEKTRFPPGSALLDFIDGLVIPYLYGLSYADEHGTWAPWGEYSHGVLGIVEFYADDQSAPTEETIRSTIQHLRTDQSWADLRPRIRKPRGMRECVCGSRKPFMRCHPKAWIGVFKVYRDMKRLGIDSRAILN